MPNRPTFMPGPRVSNILIALGFTAVGTAMWMRYLVIEPSVVGLECEAGLASTQCLLRRVTIGIHQHWGFGLAAIACALLNLIRPSAILFGAGIVTAGLGIVLYNISLSAIAVGLLILSFARPAPREARPSE